MVLDGSLTAVLTLVSGEFAVIYSFHELYKLILVYSISKGVSLQYTVRDESLEGLKFGEFGEFVKFAKL